MQKTKNNSRKNFQELIRKSKDNRRFSNQVMANVNMILSKSNSIFPKSTKKQFSTKNLFSRTTKNFNNAMSRERSISQQKEQPSFNNFSDKNIINILKSPNKYSRSFNNTTPINKINTISSLKSLMTPSQKSGNPNILEKITNPTIKKIQGKTVLKEFKTPTIKDNTEKIFENRNIKSSEVKKSPKNIKDKISLKTPDLNKNSINISPNISVEVNQKNGFSDFDKIWQEIGNRLNSEISSSASGFH